MSIQKTCLILCLILSGCAKTASETATEAALQQSEAIYQQIKKECPESNIEAPIAALKATINNQLASCEVEKSELREQNNTLLVILIGIAIIFFISKYEKIKKGLFK